MTDTILIVDDEADIRNLIRGILEDEGYDTQEAESAKKAYEAMEECCPALIVLDIWLQGSHQDGLEILKSVKAAHPHVPIIMISGHGTIETAVSAIKDGAYDFIEKPFKSDRLLLMIRRALEASNLMRENEDLRKSIDISRDLIGSSSVIKKIRASIERIAPTDSRTLITGAPGSGKDVAARLIHRLSNKSQDRLHVFNCTEYQDSSIADSLSKALRNPSGTLFLDEISFLSTDNQNAVTEALKSLESTNRFRIIASSSHDLEERAQDGSFSKGLYHRLAVNVIDMPKLSDRREDISELCAHFIKTSFDTMDRSALKIAPCAMDALKSYDWPGQTKQLKSLIEWLTITYKNPSQPLQLKDLPQELNSQKMSVAQDNDMNLSSLALREAREEFEKQYLKIQIKRFDGNISQTAKFIGMERSALHRKLKSLGILSEDPERKRA